MKSNKLSFLQVLCLVSALLALVLMVVNIIGHRSNILTLGLLLIVVGQIIVFFGIRSKDKE